MRRLALAALLVPAPALCQDPPIPEGKVVIEDQSEALRDMQNQLESDPALREALVERIMRSKVAAAITSEPDEQKRRETVREYVSTNLLTSAELAIGLARDDAAGNNKFENGITQHLKQTYRRNNEGRGAYGVLKDAAKTSKLTTLTDQTAGEEEKREQLRNLFEGKGSMSDRIITGEAPKGGPGGESPAAASPALAATFYDRLSAGNIRGYSPQLMAFQSALNRRRPPGAPALIETGKLDHATLSYPAFGLRFDLGNMEERLRRARLAELADLAGVQLSERDLKDPELESKLMAKLPAGKVRRDRSKRDAAIARAKTALADFEAAAEKAKDPSKISKALLVELSGRQREATRWLTAASLEEELDRLEGEDGFLTADLLAAIDAVPAPAATRENYKKRGEGYKARLDKLKANAQAALAALQSDGWLARVPEIERSMAESAGLRRNLSRDVSDYRLVPFRVAEAVHKQPRWREIVDDILVKYAKSTSYGRAVAVRRGKLARFLSIFGLIASGDSEAARRSLLEVEPGRR